MTTNPTRRFLSIDLLGEAEHARSDEFGNRAVLTAPASAPAEAPFATGMACSTRGARSSSEIVIHASSSTRKREPARVRSFFSARRPQISAGSDTSG